MKNATNALARDIEKIISLFLYIHIGGWGGRASAFVAFLVFGQNGGMQVLASPAAHRNAGRLAGPMARGSIWFCGPCEIKA